VITRCIRYGGEDIDDYMVFPKYEFSENNEKFLFKPKGNNVLDTARFKNKKGEFENLKTILSHTSTRGFVVIQNDSILFEEYFNGYTKQDISTIFSSTKSVTSLLIGIAIDEGFIENVNDPVTKYVEELRTADPMFKKLTIRHLLDMRSGIKFSEHYSHPLSKMARLYYGTNQLGKIKRMSFECEPGEKHEYQSVSTAILGIVLEKATGQSLAKYFEDKVWKPLKMENRASWSLDDKKHQSAKAYSGLNISAIDFAKIGRLYLNKGLFEGEQIVSEGWINETFTPKVSNDGYQNQWYSFSASGPDSLGNKYFRDSLSAVKVWNERYKGKYSAFKISKIRPKGYKKWYREKYMWTDVNEYRWQITIYPACFYTLGIMHQIMYVDTKRNIIIVRLGDTGDYNYLKLMYNVCVNS
jgi:CubicO group peptidase (beta-lactamase class C family)